MLGQKRNNSVFLKKGKYQNGAEENEIFVENEAMDTSEEINMPNEKESEGEVVSNISEKAIEILETKK